MQSVVIILLCALIFTGLVFAGAELSLYALPSYTIAITAYMIFMTVAVVMIIERQNNRMLFSQAYLASIVFKILTGLGVILVLFQLDPKGAALNAGLFIVSYIAFTAIEIGCLLRTIRSHDK